MARAVSYRRVVALGCCAATFLLFPGCIPQMVDRFVAGPVIDRATDVPDVDQACKMGAALSDAILATSRRSRVPHRALVVAETTAGLCAEARAWEASLQAARAEGLLSPTDPWRAWSIKDARIREDRAREQAARRFYRAFEHAESAWGPIGEGECPRVRERDEFVFLLGLYAGTVALLHDKAGGGAVGVPLDVLPRVARAVACVDTEKWWYLPTALQAAAWATIPGSGPPNVDPWKQLHDAAVAGQTSGVRLGWALNALIAANAGRTEEVKACIRSHAASLKTTPSAPDWALLDAYATLVTLHESDLIWISTRGYRTPALGRLPEDLEVHAPEIPFDEDPFAAP